MAVLDQADEIVGDARLLDPERHIRRGKQRLDLGGEDESGRAGVVVERLHAEMIAGAEQQVAASVPYGEGEVAEEMRRAFLAPTPVSGENDRRVADRLVRKAKLGDQVLAIVEPCVGAHRDVALRQRLGFRPAEAPEETMAKAGAALMPDGAAVRAAMGHRPQHAPEHRRFRGAPVRMDYAGDGAHDGRP